MQGAPGVYSARYAGAGATDQKNNEKLLKSLENVPKEERTARFHCVLVYMRHADDPTPIICHGTWEGEILTTAMGEQGFGYDPLFWIAEKEMSSAQLPREIKNSLSHRGEALKQLVKHFN